MSEQNDPITKNPKDAVQDFLHSSAKPEDSEDGDEVVTQFNPETGEEETVTTREVSKTAQKVVKKVVAKQVCQTTVKKETREIEEVEEVHTIKKKLFQDGKEIDCQETSNTTKTTGEKVIQGPEEVTKEETVVMITEETNPEGSTDKTITKTINKEHTIKDDNTIINNSNKKEMIDDKTNSQNEEKVINEKKDDEEKKLPTIEREESEEPNKPISEELINNMKKEELLPPQTNPIDNTKSDDKNEKKNIGKEESIQNKNNDLSEEETEKRMKEYKEMILALSPSFPDGHLSSFQESLTYNVLDMEKLNSETIKENNNTDESKKEPKPKEEEIIVPGIDNKKEQTKPSDEVVEEEIVIPSTDDKKEYLEGAEKETTEEIKPEGLVIDNEQEEDVKTERQLKGKRRNIMKPKKKAPTNSEPKENEQNTEEKEINNEDEQIERYISEMNKYKMKTSPNQDGLTTYEQFIATVPSDITEDTKESEKIKEEEKQNDDYKEANKLVSEIKSVNSEIEELEEEQKQIEAELAKIEICPLCKQPLKGKS